MTIVNTYVPPRKIVSVSEPVLDEPYDVNYNAPFPDKLESDRLRLVPFIPAIHVRAFHKAYTACPELEQYLPISILKYSDFLTFLETMVRSDSSSFLFAMIDRTKPNDGANIEESIAGMIGFVHTDPAHLSTEYGPVIVLPAFQRTFVSTHAIGLLLNYTLNLPRDGGLGYRRVVWSADPNNAASIHAAQRMGFDLEGTFRWNWVLPVGKHGGKPRVDGTRGAGEGRDSTRLALTWDKWDAGVKERVALLMARR